MTRRHWMRSACAAAAGAARAQAQGKPDFSGWWELDLPRSSAPGELPFITQEIHQSDNLLRWITLFKHPEEAGRLPAFLFGLADQQVQLAIDGEEEVTKRGSLERRSRTVWEGSRLVTTWSVKNPREPLQGKWVRSLAADGRTQTILAEVRSPQRGTARVKLVFVKK